MSEGIAASLIVGAATLAAFVFGLWQGRAERRSVEGDQFIRGQFMGIAAIWLDTAPEERDRLLAALDARWHDPALRSEAVLLGASAYRQWRLDFPDGDSDAPFVIPPEPRPKANRHDVR